MYAGSGWFHSSRSSAGFSCSVPQSLILSAFASSESFSRLTCQMADVSAGGPISEGLMTPQVLQKHLRETEVYKCEEAAGGADSRLVYTNYESSTTTRDSCSVNLCFVFIDLFYTFYSVLFQNCVARDGCMLE